MEIWIVRHGETKANEEGRLQGWSDDPLNDMGIKLAVETGKAMRGIIFDKVFSSPLTRAKQTSEVILHESGNSIPITLDDRIKEINMGDFEGKRFRPGESEVDSSVMREFFDNPNIHKAFPNGESIKQVMERTQEFIHEIAKKEFKMVLVATHGCALRCMLNFLYENPNEFWHSHVPYNCCINILEVSDNRISLVEDDKILYDKSLCVDRYSEY